MMGGQDPMMMDQQQPPMNDMGGPMGPGMTLNNGGMDPMMDNGFGMMDNGGGMGMMPPDHNNMGGGGPYDMMQGQQQDFYDSEYCHGAKQPGHDQERPLLKSVVSRQNSSASLDLDIVSVKKIEDREDEYGKVKQALLSDLNEFDDDSSPVGPEFDPYRNLTTSVSSRPRSKDNLESIFGGRHGVQDFAAEPHLDTSAESRSSLISTTTMITSNSSYHSSFLDAKHVFNAVEESHSTGVPSQNNNNLLHMNKAMMVEETFPVCITSPELDALAASHLHRRPSSAVSSAALGDAFYATIPEVPEEEGGSPITGDGVSRAIRRGKTILKIDKNGYSPISKFFQTN
jgi:hypothetical protein